MSETAAKTCIYPGCERPAVPANPLGGPQPAFCDLEEHNALTAHQERRRLAKSATARQEATTMADEAYRAVFLRVHPTGKMVLSLTTESDGKEAEYAQLVADELGIPALDVKVVPADTDRFGVGHGYNTSPSEGTAAAIAGAAEKIRAKGAAARRHGAGDLAGDASSGQRRLGPRRRKRPDPGQDGRGDRALRPRHRRPAAGSRGRARRADRVYGLTELNGIPYREIQSFTTAQSRLAKNASM